MAIVLDATVGGMNSNSYITLTRAATIAETIPKMIGWFNDLDMNQKQLLIYATRLIDLHFTPYGERAISTQALYWPRTGVRHHASRAELSSLTIPEFVEYATVEWAWAIHKDEVTGVNEIPGISELRTQNYWFKFNQQTLPTIPGMVTRLLSPYTVKQIGSFVRLTRV